MLSNPLRNAIAPRRTNLRAGIGLALLVRIVISLRLTGDNLIKTEPRFLVQPLSHQETNPSPNHNHLDSPKGATPTHPTYLPPKQHQYNDHYYPSYDEFNPFNH